LNSFLRGQLSPAQLGSVKKSLEGADNPAYADNTYTFQDNTTPNYDNIVFEKLNIHSNFIGTYFIDNKTLTLRLDMHNDGSVSGSEGLFIFQLNEN
jgi:hypothetical protein